MSKEGWQAAWGYICSELPKLAEAVTTAWLNSAEARAEARAAAERRAATRASLDAEGCLDKLVSCIYLGGYGVDPGLAPADRVDLYFTQKGIWLTPAGSFKPYLRVRYECSRALEFEGGTVRTGGGYVGGGFGAAGAAEGMAIAGLLNSLTSKSSVHTTIRYEADQAEIFLFTDKATPRSLELRLADPRARIRNRSAPEAAAGSSVPGSDLVTQLTRLGEMLDKGQLTEQEFAAAKTRLLSNQDR